jgi:hypothetical protein
MHIGIPVRAVFLLYRDGMQYLKHKAVEKYVYFSTKTE